MKNYPVIIPTLNRYTHFRNCVESLSRCTHADKTELVIGLDYPPSSNYEEGYQKIKKYIPIISGFAKVTVFEHDKNLGPSGNWRYLIEYCNQYYDACIGTEDDNVFSPAFLDYMDHALEIFRDDESVTSVSGYNFEEAYNQGIYTHYLGKDYSAWGVGFWFHKEAVLRRQMSEEFYRKLIHSPILGKRLLNVFPANYQMLDFVMKKDFNINDVHRAAYNIITNHYQVKPAISLVRNCGFDGSGVNCGVEEFGRNVQKISSASLFDFGMGVGPADTEINRVALYYHELPADEQERKYVIRHIRLLYLKNAFPLCYKMLIRIENIRIKLALRTRIKKFFF